MFTATVVLNVYRIIKNKRVYYEKINDTFQAEEEEEGGGGYYFDPKTSVSTRKHRNRARLPENPEVNNAGHPNTKTN